MSHILPLGVSSDFLKIECSRPSSLNYPFLFSFIFILFCWFFFVDFAFAQWVYFDASLPCASSYQADSLGKFSFVSVGSVWPSTLISSSSFDAYVHCLSSASGDSVFVDDLLNYVGILPPLPSGYSGGIYTQAQLDAAVLSASAGGGTPMTFAQGGEIAAAVASASLVAVAFGLVRKAMT